MTERKTEFLSMPEGGNVTPEQIQASVDSYLDQNPVQAGATAEQAAQIEQNAEDIAELNSDLDNKYDNIPIKKKNLIDDDAVMLGKTVDVYTHEIKDGTNSFVQILKLKGNTDLAFYHNDKNINALIHVFDKSGNYIQLINNGTGTVVKTHENASYGYYTLSSVCLPTATVIESSEPITEYVEKGYKFTKKIRMPEKFINDEKSFDENVIPTEAIKPRAVTNDKIDSYDIKKATVFNRKNLFNPDTCAINKKADMPNYSAENYVENDDDYWCLSDFIPVEEDTNYKLNDTLFLYRFDKDKKCIGFINPTVTTITIPTGTCYVKVNAHNISVNSNIYTKKYYIFHVIIAKESEYDEAFIETYRKYHTNETVDSLYTQRLYNVNEIYNHWVDGEKFPIAFYGDSTTEGDSTTDSSGTMNDVSVTNNTLGSDYIWESAYPNLLETMMKDMTGNSVQRVYNAGFSGKDSEWAWQNYEKEFGSGAAYEDTKIIFLGFGINDRVNVTLLGDLYEKTKKFTELLVIKIKKDNKQPVIMTTQPYYSYFSSGVLNTRNAQRTINRALLDVAKEFNLEIIDRYTELCNMFVNSSKSIGTYLHTDLLHCNNGGHLLERDLLAHRISSVIKNVTYCEKVEISDYCFENVNMQSNSEKINGYSMYCDVVTTDGAPFISAMVYSEKNVQIDPKNIDNTSIAIKVNGEEKTTLDVGLNKIEFIGNGQRIRLMGFDIIN